MRLKQITMRAALFSAAAMVAVLLNGCGGSEIRGDDVGSTPASGPVVLGLQPVLGGQVSGLGRAADPAAPTSGDVAFVTYATASTGRPLPSIAVDDTIPLGAAPGGRYIDAASGPFPQAVTTGAPNVTFRAALANGQDPNNNEVIRIVESSVRLTSSEAPGFSQPLTFRYTSNPAGPFANAAYATAPFALPFTTTGLHSLTVSVADERNQSSTTTFDVAVVASNTSVVVAQIVRPGATATAAPIPVPGATATITNPISGARAKTTADDQGVVVLFAAPGAQTITATGGARRGTATATLPAGQALVSTGSGASTAPFRVTIQ